MDDPRVVFVSARSGLVQDWSWVAETADRFDVVHWHDGVDGTTVAQARGLVAALEAAGKPLVVSVPQAALDSDPSGAFTVLISSASALIVATPEAADEVWRRWGRVCVVAVSRAAEDGLARGHDGVAEDASTVVLYRSVVDDQPFAAEVGRLESGTATA